jgi:signal transduction histidine kinase
MPVSENKPNAPNRRSRAYWVCQALGWGGYGVVYFVAVLLPLHQGGAVQAVIDLAYCLTGLLGTHLLHSRIKLDGWSEMQYRALIPRLLVSALLVGLSQTIVLDSSLALEHQFNWNQMGQVLAVFGSTVFFSALLVGLWLAIYLGVEGARRRHAAVLDALRTEVLIREASLRSLQQQLNPHFLFNCLNSLRGMIDEDSKRAQVMVTRLAELLRSSLRQDQRSVISVEEELTTVNAYLELESVRFEERLRMRQDIDPQALSALVPPMLLQCLVENAIKHGISQLTSGGELEMRIRRSAEQLQVDICNTGSLRGHLGTGIGLANARQRLRLLYGDRAELTLREDPPGWVHATLVLPFQNVEAMCEQSS